MYISDTNIISKVKELKETVKDLETRVETLEFLNEKLDDRIQELISDQER